MSVAPHNAPDPQALQRALRTLRQGLGELPAMLREVDAVASKTKLLGFNASILAAQAGSEGRSFAVVAEQMKALNQRAEAATKRLHLCVDGLQRAAARALEVQPNQGGFMDTPRSPHAFAAPESPAPPEGPTPEVQPVSPEPEVPKLPEPPTAPEVG